ncbi:MAG: hypothetical protein SCALA702_03610 [Melioribacteraceae bacterium]|nr:MAG: hypothetical protein SCALA702_03610 [Melioribacteraceae bacterium]
MKKIIICLFLLSGVISAQSISLEEASKLAEWDRAGLHASTVFSKMSTIDIAQKYKNLSDYSDAVEKEAAAAKGKPIVLFFPRGEYKFKKPIQFGSNILIKGEGAGKTKLIFELSGNKNSAVTFKGIPKRTVDYKGKITAGENFILKENSSQNLRKGDIVKIFQGKNEWGKSSSGNKKFEKGQILRVQGAIGQKVIFDTKFRLSYDVKDENGEQLKIMLIRPVKNSGLENLSITRLDKPSSGSHAIIHFDYVENCLVSGVESLKGANNHLFLRNAINCEVTGSYFSGAHSTGGGGNGYGVSIGNCSSHNLIENNIFEGLRHSIIFATSSNANVVYANASFNKPVTNLDEAAIVLHGHYPYMNLFESNYVEFICVDNVWGENGPANVFFRNIAYDDGLFGFMNSKEIEIERGNDNAFIIANIAKIENHGNNRISENLSPGNISQGIKNQEKSLWKKSRNATGHHSVVNGKFLEIPAKQRFSSSVKTVERKDAVSGTGKRNTNAIE